MLWNRNPLLMRDIIRLRAPVSRTGLSVQIPVRGGPGSLDHGGSASPMSFVTQIVTRFIVTQIVTRLNDSDSHQLDFCPLTIHSDYQFSYQYTSSVISLLVQLSVISLPVYQTYAWFQFQFMHISLYYYFSSVISYPVISDSVNDINLLFWCHYAFSSLLRLI